MKLLKKLDCFHRQRQKIKNSNDSHYNDKVYDYDGYKVMAPPPVSTDLPLLKTVDEDNILKYCQTYNTNKPRSVQGKYCYMTEDEAITTTTTFTDDDSCTSSNLSWKSFLIESNKESGDDNKETSIFNADTAVALSSKHEILHRSRNLPSTSYYSNNHIMVNKERTKRLLQPLIRNSELDAAARWHAEAMAAATKLYHSNPAELQLTLQQQQQQQKEISACRSTSLNDSVSSCQWLGENIAKGKAIRIIHGEMIKSVCDKMNMIHHKYTEMGMATARGSDGNLYLCQVFRG